MVNPIGGAHSGEKSYKDIVAPVFDLAGIATEVIGRYFIFNFLCAKYTP